MVEDFASHEQASLRPIKKPGKTLNKGRGVAQDIDRGEPAAIELYPVATPQPSHTYAWLTPAMILFIALALQFLLVMRHEIAARFPEYKTQLLGLLAPLGLSLELPRKYEAITIESFELQASEPNGGEAQYFYAQALLRNRSAYAVQWPAIELSLTDPAGQLLARKVLLASDYLGSPEAREQGFAARSEKSLRIKLSLNQITPNGYSAVLFYP